MPTREEKVAWISKNLSSILEFPVPNELIEYICSIENDKDVTEYCSSLLDLTNPRHSKFVSDLRQMLSASKVVTPQDMKKDNANLKKRTNQKFVDIQKQEIMKKEAGKSEFNSDTTKLEFTKDKGKKKATKFVNLYSQDGQAKDVVMLKGRHPCTCEASIHGLINNCMKCGRIVCSQEGAGPCIFCGNLVCTPEQQQQIQTGSKKSDKLREHLMKQTISKEDAIALKKRDKLLEYDKTCDRMTRVIDDESDYYATTSVWLSADEKAMIKKRDEEIQELLNTSHKNMKYTLDFTGRSFIEESKELPIDPFNDPVLRKINQSICNASSMDVATERNANPMVPELHYLEPDHLTGHPNQEMAVFESRIQDRELMEMSDRGMCLSMHQPWASLLVEGLKVHEGRSWYSAHRGTLWIAAAAKQPTPDDIKEVEQQTKSCLGSAAHTIKFPVQYPVGCLLGCVNVVDCLPQDEYRGQYPLGPSLEPFVFICEHPRKLPIFFPMKGKHKIFKLDTKLLQAAQRSLKRVAKLQSQSQLSEDA